MSPTAYVLAASCAWYFFERRMVFFIVGWVKRRSTRTITVLSCLSLTTTPCSVRLGIWLPLALGLGARRALRLGCGRSRRLGLRRRHRLPGALERRDGLDARDVAADDPHPRRVLELVRGPLEAQVEL